MPLISTDRTRQLAFVLFLVLIGVGVLAFLVSLNLREDAMPPLPPGGPFFEDKPVVEEEDLEAQPPGIDEEMGVDSEEEEPRTRTDELPPDAHVEPVP